MNKIDGLTREQVLAMEPGRELDLLVAEYVMNFSGMNEPVPFSDKDWFTYHHDMGFFRYSSDIKPAFEVVEKMPIPFRVEKSYQEVFGIGPLGWSVNWCDNYGDCGCHLEGDTCINGKSVWSETAPLAICRAALLAVIDQ